MKGSPEHVRRPVGPMRSVIPYNISIIAMKHVGIIVSANGSLWHFCVPSTVLPAHTVAEALHDLRQN